MDIDTFKKNLKVVQVSFVFETIQGTNIMENEAATLS